jgi:hypothetical protein
LVAEEDWDSGAAAVEPSKDVAGTPAGKACRKHSYHCSGPGNIPPSSSDMSPSSFNVLVLMHMLS